jgi:hypothetical protein
MSVNMQLGAITSCRDERRKMENEVPFRIISAILFLVMWGVRKYYERQAAKVAQRGLAQDRDDKVIIGNGAKVTLLM